MEVEAVRDTREMTKPVGTEILDVGSRGSRSDRGTSVKPYQKRVAWQNSRLMRRSKSRSMRTAQTVMQWNRREVMMYRQMWICAINDTTL